MPDEEEKEHALNQQKQKNDDNPPKNVAEDVDDEDYFAAAEVTSNPHDSRGIEAPLPDQTCNVITEKPACLGGTMPCVDNMEALLGAQNIVTKSLEEITQKDTLHKITTTNILNVKNVPIYHFQQPGRISPQQLPFSLVLVSRLDRVPHQEIFVEDKSKREDSWFLDHYWSPVVVCACELSCNDNNTTARNNIPEADRFLHIGWKFTSLVDQSGVTNDGGTELSSFYALIIQPKNNDKQNIKKLEIIGFKAPGWMLKNGTARVTNI